MKSKEMKERLSKRPNPHNLYTFNEEQVKELIKDLEILDILKEWLVYYEYEEAIMTYRDIPLDIKEKIMRWLEDEK